MDAADPGKALPAGSSSEAWRAYYKQQCRSVGAGAAVITLPINPATGGMLTF